MTKLMFATLVFAAGCGTLFNKRQAEIGMDPGVEVDGQSISTTIDQREEHTVSYPDGRTCKITPGVSGAYIILDIFLTGPIGIIVDAVTGDWTVAKSDCPGVWKK
jgi:hypothetical protein